MYLRNFVPGAGPRMGEGEIVASIPLPRNGFRSDFIKWSWGIDELRNYVGSKHGHEYRDRVQGAPRQDRLTGTQVTLIVGAKKVCYMLVEPRRQDPTDPKVHVVKTEESIGEGDCLDVIIHNPRAAEPTTNLGEILKQKLAGRSN